MIRSLSTPSKRSAPTNSIQKNILIEYMEQNPNLRAGTFGPDFTLKNAQTLWEIVTMKLNAVPRGAKKDDWRMWRKTWADMKKNATSKAVRFKKESQKTGGGTPPKSDLNEDDIMILDMINTKKIEGITEISESEVFFHFTDDTTEINQLELNIENVQDEPQPSLIERTEEGTHEGKSSTLLGTDGEVVAGDHKWYTTPASRGKTKQQRLQTSLDISKQMVDQVEYQNNFTNQYFVEKMEYLEHKIKHEDKMLEVALQNVEIAKEHLKIMKDNLRVNSSILNILANKK